MIIFQAWRFGAILLLTGLALFQPARAFVSHRELRVEHVALESVTGPSAAPAASTPAPTNGSAAPTPSPSPLATTTGAPSAEPSPIETGLVPVPSATPKSPPLRVNPGLLQNSNAPIPATSAGPSETGSQYADELSGGVWHCRTFAGIALTHIFAQRDAAPSLEVDTQVPVGAGRFVTLHESFTHKVETGTWHATLANGQIEATAPEWSGDTWMFTGSQLEGGKKVGFRMIFTRFGSDVYVRDFQHREGQAWQTFSGETCRRDAAP